ncbi:MAG TPA: hypothetical protein VL025_17005 [Thermoanaerobaculia bacterium]|nr:hypothetical protein [Thermoanaerobaculia bacterium]
MPSSDNARLKVDKDKVPAKPRGAMAMLGFARLFRQTRRTEDWMEDLREAEKDDHQDKTKS